MFSFVLIIVKIIFLLMNSKLNQWQSDWPDFGSFTFPSFHEPNTNIRNSNRAELKHSTKAQKYK